MLHYSLLLLGLLAPTIGFAQRDFYTPKSLLMPLHEQARQLQVAAGVGGGYQLHLSYTLTRHLVVFQTATLDNALHQRRSLFGDAYQQRNRNYVLTGGLGYFTPLNRSFLTVVEAYAGAGLTRMVNSWAFGKLSDEADFTHARYWTAFSQVNVGRRVTHWEMAFGLRLVYARYQQLRYYQVRYPHYTDVHRVEELRGLLLEPVLSGSFLWKAFKLNAQAGVSSPLSAPPAQVTVTGYTGIAQADPRADDLPELGGLLGRLSVQYTVGLGRKK
ncbi:hypothetical protein [Hymenobacter profundi]|uniref:DUF2490 domain-containing protein n=1 Tax=Hymenobacter profundi TaxID=1982110 RepID=A0ABS6X0T4_9BACT|nr:hypothetical protein [Hymenobacter profundi]MBW3129436.1 hypothetical protein [Hymenobacter profundi]